MHKYISFEQAACIPIAGLTALQALRDYGRISYGKKVLINGASGGVGHLAVQIANIFGAEVTGVCSRPNVSSVQALGADRVIDHTAEDFTKSGNRYDIIFDAVAKSSFRACRKIMTSHGIYVSTLPSLGIIVNQYVTGYFQTRKAKIIWVRQSEADLDWMMNQVVANRIRVAIENVYPLDRVKEALALSEAGKARGKLVIQIGE
jgi:NADPH:quinone reductase-like Zn-dependent oxidoreductase